MTDVREMIPEFFYLPDMFINCEKHDFGIQQTNERVHNVDMPSWANRDPYFFVVMFRKALEGQYVSKNIHKWIDLIFGYKQKGKEAENSLNVFYYLTYENSIDLDTIKDEKEKVSLESQIMHFG